MCGLSVDQEREGVLLPLKLNSSTRQVELALRKILNPKLSLIHSSE